MECFQGSVELSGEEHGERWTPLLLKNCGAIDSILVNSLKEETSGVWGEGGRWRWSSLCPP